MDKTLLQKNKTLSIRISTNGFCFCSYTATIPDSLQYYFYEVNDKITLAANLDEALKEVPFTDEGDYEDVRIIIDSDKFTAIPEEYDDKEAYDSLFRSCFPQTTATERIIANRLPAQGITLLFSIENILFDRLCKLGNITFYTPPSIILGFLEKHSIDESRYMFAYYNHKTLLLLSITDGRLKLVNCFKSDDAHDHAFYTLSIWKEQELLQEENCLYICGDKGVEELSPILKLFIRKTRRINPNELFRPHLLNRISKIPFDLQALLLCE